MTERGGPWRERCTRIAEGGTGGRKRHAPASWCAELRSLNRLGQPQGGQVHLRRIRGLYNRFSIEPRAVCAPGNGLQLDDGALPPAVQREYRAGPPPKPPCSMF